MKKTIFFMLCLAPLGVQAEPFAGGEAPLTTGGSFQDGISVTDIVVGQDVPSSAPNYSTTLWRGTDASDGFTLRSGADITVSNNVTIAEGYHLGLGVTDVPGTPVNMSFGSITANGSFAVEKANAFTVDGVVSIADGFSLQANTAQTGSIAVTGGNTNLDVTGTLEIGSFSNSGTGSTIIAADSIDVNTGDIENSGSAGDMTVSAAGNIDVAGSVYNSSSTMNITAGGDITIAGTVKNDSNDSKIVVNAENLTVSGGDNSNASFVNKGDLVIDVTGTTNLEYGFDLSAMQTDNTFSLTTGSLVFGSGTNTDNWLNVFSNKLSQFTLNITNDSLDIASDVINGLINDDISNPSYNEDANMSLTAQAITADSVTNHGNNLTMQATELDGAGIVINGGVEGFAGSTTKIASAAVLNIKGDVSNSGNMTLNGTQVELASVVNDGGDLSITSLTNEIGQITISGDVTNKSGNTDINAKDIVISGTLTNQSGILTVQGSDTAGSDLQIGAIEVAGGVLDLNALIGGVNVAGAVNVTGGALNIDSSTHSLTAANTIQINGDFILGENTEADGNGEVYVSATGPQGFVMTSTNGALNIGGAVEAIQSGTYSATFAADTITIGGNVTASGAGKELVFGADSSQQLTVDGAIAVDGGASIAIVSDDANVGSINVDANSSLIASGTQITATNGAIDVAGGLWFGGINPKPENGLIVENTNNLTLKSDNAQVEIGGALDLGAGNTLTLDAANSSVIANGNITAGGILNANAQNINMGNITNTGTTTLVATDTVNLGNVAANSGNLNITANGTTNPNVVLGGMTVASGAVVNIGSDEILNVKSSGDIVVSGNISQGNQSGALNFLADSINVNGNAGLQLIGSYEANSGTALLEFANAVSITENVNVAEGAEVVFDAATFAASDIDNSGLLAINSDNGINLNQISNTGSLTLNSGKGFTTVDTFAVGSLGNITLEGAGLTTAGVFTTSDTILYQNYSGNMTDGMVNVASDDYSITASQFGVAGIEQKSGYMQINSSDVDISGNVIAGDLRFAKNPADTWIDATIGGNVSGGVDFWGIKRLNIAGNYTFNNDSDLWAAILPYQDSESLSGDTTNQNYWSTIEATADNKVGEITNAENGAALITIGEQFISNISGIVNNTADNAPQVGITLFDTVDQGTAIWLLHAEKGIVVTDAFEKLRNLDVKFCNADGTVCIDYADTLHPANDGTYSDEGDSPIYISERDTDGDGVADSLYVVFDPNFGGPVEVFRIQPIVAATEPHTEGEYVSAGALDNLIVGQLQNTKFYNSTPIELIPQIFKGTNLAQMADELYDRMEYYNMTGERDPLARFSRLFQARELEQIAGAVALNEHTSFRDFEDRMFDEFIWNRNRNLKKAWLDVDYGMFFQNVSDGKHADGNRFSIAGGFDWQNSETTILGLTARISNSSSDNSDAMELGYLPDTPVAGFVDLTVDDLNIGLGGYMMKTLGEKTRLYGNGFLDIHLFDVSRDQTFMDHIDGSGSAFSLITEWGLLHDWLNQYIVGNAYARVGYNFGFDITEHAAGQDYMNMQSDGYLILTPGYSLTAQKRIYPSAWFQIRPYASIGVEYDVLGAPDYVKYKFALAHTYTKYDVDIDPLWANIGGGIEFLSASGIQLGIDYRYQYNDAIQLHNIKVSGSYRF